MLLAGCATSGTETQKPNPKQVEEMRAAANTLTARLGSKLKAEMAANGPESAIGVCKSIAPQIAADLSKQTGWKVGRAGTRVRNPGSAVPTPGMPRRWRYFPRASNKARNPTRWNWPSGREAIRDLSALCQSRTWCNPCASFAMVLPNDIPTGVKPACRPNTPWTRRRDTAWEIARRRRRLAAIIRRWIWSFRYCAFPCTENYAMV